ncbi:MAG: hypothetical protein WCB63_05920 [Polyangiales bacterium]
MRGLFPTPETSFRWPATDAQMKVIVVSITARRLVKNPGGSDDRLR